eukprot:TRINITY_DN2885_c0_g1_i3.p1 TRINITY_DN2885_c0_g1~~TRINITY_DN2885_c0_g1_i3.p1  ORF type:complete len:260 (+),score=-30.35 TRINITY_DN2885_c0_g1_i3:99-782(+)
MTGQNPYLQAHTMCASYKIKQRNFPRENTHSQNTFILYKKMKNNYILFVIICQKSILLTKPQQATNINNHKMTGQNPYLQAHTMCASYKIKIQKMLDYYISFKLHKPYNKITQIQIIIQILKQNMSQQQLPMTIKLMNQNQKHFQILMLHNKNTNLSRIHGFGLFFGHLRLFSVFISNGSFVACNCISQNCEQSISGHHLASGRNKHTSQSRMGSSLPLPKTGHTNF